MYYLTPGTVTQFQKFNLVTRLISLTRLPKAYKTRRRPRKKVEVYFEKPVVFKG